MYILQKDKMDIKRNELNEFYKIMIKETKIKKLLGRKKGKKYVCDKYSKKLKGTPLKWMHNVSISLL